MAFIQNAWYCAVWSHELTPAGPAPLKPLARKICGEDIVFYRSQTTQQVTALHDMCPHRFAPMSYGDVVGDNIKCRYHGLQFDSNGDCVVDPGSDKPPKMCIKKYPVEEKDGMIYIWIGNKTPDKPAPDWLKFGEGFGAEIRGFLEVKANYKIMMDNLMDDAHATNLHELLSTEGHTARPDAKVLEDEPVPDTVTSIIDVKDTSVIPLYKKYWKKPGSVDQQISIQWNIPAASRIMAGIYEQGGNPENQIGNDALHTITPVDEHSCYYFWCIVRNVGLEDHTITENMSKMFYHIFSTEDAWMAEAQQRRIAEKGFWESKPALMPQDKAAAIVRRRIEKLEEKTNAGGAATLLD
jgi:vanillate O-demethylase monooxygenase subunit